MMPNAQKLLRSSCEVPHVIFEAIINNKSNPIE